MRRKSVRKIKKDAIITVHSAGVVALIVTGFFMLMCYWMLGMRCTSIAGELEQAEKQYKQLTLESERVASRWTELMAVDRLKDRLTRFGLEMDMPRADEIVRMKKGRPVQGQIAVARAKERLATANMAQVAPGAQLRKRATRRKVR